jgi:hypothetical protein
LMSIDDGLLPARKSITIEHTKRGFILTL